MNSTAACEPTSDASLNRPLLAHDYEDPKHVVQRAWSVLRLNRLQQLIVVTIAELRGLAPAGLMGRDLAAREGEGDDPLTAALEACCVELEEAGGIDGADAERERRCGIVRSLIAEQPLSWTRLFMEALDNYRRRASRSLSAAFAAEPQQQ